MIPQLLYAMHLRNVQQTSEFTECFWKFLSLMEKVFNAKICTYTILFLLSKAIVKEWNFMYHTVRGKKYNFQLEALPAKHI